MSATPTNPGMGHSRCSANLPVKESYTALTCRYCDIIHYGYSGDVKDSGIDFWKCYRCKHDMPWSDATEEKWELRRRCWSCNVENPIFSRPSCWNICQNDQCGAPWDGPEVFVWMRLVRGRKGTSRYDSYFKENLEEIVLKRTPEWRENNRMVEEGRPFPLLECGHCGRFWKGKGGLKRDEKTCYVMS